MKKMITNDEKHKAYVHTFQSETGQDVLLDLFMVCHMNEVTTFVPGDPHMSAFKEGQRSVIMAIIKKCNLDISAFIRAAQKQQQ